MGSRLALAHTCLILGPCASPPDLCRLDGRHLDWLPKQRRGHPDTRHAASRATGELLKQPQLNNPPWIQAQTHQSPNQGKSPYLLSTRITRWTGTRGARKPSRPPRRPTSRSFSPSVIPPATGATSWSAKASRMRKWDPAQQAFHLRQTRPRRTAGHRQDLHDLRPGQHRRRRLAHERVHDARTKTILRRHLFSQTRFHEPLQTRG